MRGVGPWIDTVGVRGSNPPRAYYCPETFQHLAAHSTLGLLTHPPMQRNKTFRLSN